MLETSEKRQRSMVITIIILKIESKIFVTCYIVSVSSFAL